MCYFPEPELINNIHVRVILYVHTKNFHCRWMLFEIGKQSIYMILSKQPMRDNMKCHSARNIFIYILLINSYKFHSYIFENPHSLNKGFNIDQITSIFKMIIYGLCNRVYGMDSVTEFMDCVTELMDSVTEFMDSVTEFMDSVTEFMDSVTEFMDSVTEFMHWSDGRHCMFHFPSLEWDM